MTTIHLPPPNPSTVVAPAPLHDVAEDVPTARPARVGVALPKATLGALVLLFALNAQALVARPSLMLIAVLIGSALVLAVAIHEFAHFAVGSMLGLDLVVRIGVLFGWCAPADGDESFADRLSPAGHAAFAAAGPIANLITWVGLGIVLGNDSAMAFMRGTAWLPLVMVLRDVSLALGLLNLLPVGFLDGGRIAQSGIAALPEAMRPIGLGLFRVFSLTACAVIALNVALNASGDRVVGTVFNLAMIVWLAIGSWMVVDDGTDSDSDTAAAAMPKRPPMARTAGTGALTVVVVGLGAVLGQIAGATWFVG